jgi:two-component system chemotaxis response regulator CheY
MPNMNGMQLLAEIKSRAEFASLPVIMITTEGSQSKVMEAAQLGAAGYIRKPFSADQIKDKISNLF